MKKIARGSERPIKRTIRTLVFRKNRVAYLPLALIALQDDRIIAELFTRLPVRLSWQHLYNHNVATPLFLGGHLAKFETANHGTVFLTLHRNILTRCFCKECSDQATG